MANKNLSKEAKDALLSVNDRITILENNGNAVAIGVYSNDNRRMVMYNTNTWDTESLVMLSEVVTAYITGEYTWEQMQGYDDSASVTNIQFANERGDLQSQLRTYVKSEIGKRNKEVHELDRQIDLVKMLQKNDFNIDLIKGKLIDKYSDDIDFFAGRGYSVNFDDVYKKGYVQKVDASHYITNLSMSKINKLIDRLEKTNKELQGV